MRTVLEIKSAIDALPLAERIDLVQMLNRENLIPHPPDGLDLEVDSPALEAELLKAANQPSVPYSAREMREMCGELASIRPHPPFDPTELRASCEEIVRQRQFAG
ncbi:MAG: hypothetical protein FD161_2881 [Limisphaerales bacterium]|nr:MAG: hypothetical protein FD161_2881 [Limisphaerales bacterium]KAG0508234.1 MAG: hypothetical protein E1N63_2632 [Limisphaerales bacterium]TXT51669.1 MAG: hypothetical protein FD140_1473 [Limisphaerales bacterium]